MCTEPLFWEATAQALSWRIYWRRKGDRPAVGYIIHKMKTYNVAHRHRYLNTRSILFFIKHHFGKPHIGINTFYALVCSMTKKDVRLTAVSG